MRYEQKPKPILSNSEKRPQPLGFVRQETTEFPQGPVPSPVEKALTELIRTFRERNEQAVAAACVRHGIRSVHLLLAIDQSLMEHTKKRRYFQLGELSRENQSYLWVPRVNVPRNLALMRKVKL